MGKGAGPLKYHVANIKRGAILLEFQSTITQELVVFFKKLILKLPVKSRVLLKAYY
jgi:ribosomal protein L16/L10AE